MTSVKTEYKKGEGNEEENHRRKQIKGKNKDILQRKELGKVLPTQKMKHVERESGIYRKGEMFDGNLNSHSEKQIINQTQN